MNKNQKRPLKGMADIEHVFDTLEVRRKKEARLEWLKKNSKQAKKGLGDAKEHAEGR